MLTHPCQNMFQLNLQNLTIQNLSAINTRRINLHQSDIVQSPKTQNPPMIVPPASSTEKKYVERVVGSFQYYGQAVDSTTLHVLSSIAT